MANFRLHLNVHRKVSCKFLLQEVPQCQQHGQTCKGSPQGQQVTTIPLQAGKLH